MKTLKRSSDNIIKYYEDTFKTIFKDSWNTFKTDKYDIVFTYPKIKIAVKLYVEQIKIVLINSKDEISSSFNFYGYYMSNSIDYCYGIKNLLKVMEENNNGLF